MKNYTTILSDKSIWMRIGDNNQECILHLFTDYDPNDPEDIQAVLHIKEKNTETKHYFGTLYQMMEKLVTFNQTNKNGNIN